MKNPRFQLLKKIYYYNDQLSHVALLSQRVVEIHSGEIALLLQGFVEIRTEEVEILV